MLLRRPGGCGLTFARLILTGTLLLMWVAVIVATVLGIYWAGNAFLVAAMLSLLLVLIGVMLDD